MTVVIKRSLNTNKASIEKLLGKINKTGKLNAFKYCGVLKLNESPIQIQKKMRDEW